jgi:two-component system chemotaxis response regulator CheB
LAPVLVVQHMSTEYFDTFLGWLSRQCQIPVQRAQAGALPRPGEVHVAPPDSELTLDADGRLRLAAAAGRFTYLPPIDPLFTSVADVHGERSVGVVLTGMGSDGAKGLLRMRQRGARTYVQTPLTCSAPGMPTFALGLEAAEEALSPAQLRQLLTAWDGSTVGSAEVHYTQAPPGGTPRVLMVDGNPAALREAQEGLERLGFQVFTGDNPLLMAHLVRSHRPDLIVLDVRMPAASGAAQALPVPVILYADLSHGRLLEKMRECGAAAFVAKSEGHAALLSTASAYVAGLRRPGWREEGQLAKVGRQGGAVTSEKPKVFIVDDSEVILETTVMALEDAGIDAIPVASPALLPKLLRQHQPDLIMMDVNMPVVDGVSLLSVVRSTPWGKCLIVFHSDQPAERLSELVRREKVDGFIRKTHKVDELVRQVREVLARLPAPRA